MHYIAHTLECAVCKNTGAAFWLALLVQISEIMHKT